MCGKRIVRAVEMSGGDDGFRTAHALLGGLEDQADGAVQLPAQFAEQNCGSNAHGGVAVVAAGVHDAVGDGGEALAVRQMRRIA